MGARRGSRFANEDRDPGSPGMRRPSRPGVRSPAGGEGSWSSSQRRASRVLNGKSSLGSLRGASPSTAQAAGSSTAPAPTGGDIEMRQVSSSALRASPQASLSLLPPAPGESSALPPQDRPPLLSNSSVPQIPAGVVAAGTPISEPLQAEVEKVIESHRAA